MTFLHTLAAFILALGVLVTIHELGHYLVARWCGVKVLRFSVGMGRVVYSRKWGKDQTEWALSALPIGGYVKMLDAREQDVSTLSPEELQREFTRQSVWRRIAIVAAGPLANFLLAIALFSALFYSVGTQTPITPNTTAHSAEAFIAGPFVAFSKGVKKTWDITRLTLSALWKMLTGDMSLKNVAGPVTIADIAGQTAKIGLVSYLSFIAVMSISLGIMNLLPIPVLDGGHLLYYSLEILMGRPLPTHVLEITQKAGIGLLMMLMSLAMYNDLVRLFS